VPHEKSGRRAQRPLPLRQRGKIQEMLSGDWKTDHARRIYRRLGDQEKYLELRNRKMVFGGDYYDLASFYWKAGEKKKALQVAEDGLRKGRGRMDELRQFLAQRGKDAGDRDRYLELQFAQTVDQLTCDKYKAFRKLCTVAEWKSYKVTILEQLKCTRDTEQLRIRMHRKEYDEAVAVLCKGCYPLTAWDSVDKIQTAQRLEKRYPEEILKY